MRDPIGRVEIVEDTVRRHAYAPLSEPHFLDTSTAAELVERGLLTPFAFESRSLVKARKVGFATYPWEWTHGQLLQAAFATLDVAEAALTEGHELKDASAFNVLFEKERPEFCDHFSTQPIQRRQWWAYGQFLRHFLFPLAVSRYLGMEPADVFKASLDGLSLETTRALLGSKCWTSRIGLALLQGQGHNGPPKVAVSPGRENSPNPLHQRLIDFLRWQLSALEQAPRISEWASYEETRDHYSEISLEFKRDIVARWLSFAAPHWVADLGCNRGEFSLVAAGIATVGVIAVDADMAAIGRLRAKLTNETSIYTVCANLDDLPRGRGWMGKEYPGLLERISAQADVAMALALVHHLVIGRSIPLTEVAELMAASTRRYLIVEYLEADDPMVQALLLSRDRIDDTGFTLEDQRRAFGQRFQTIEEIVLEGSSRRLALLEKLTPA